jgi:hypothetical protein
MTCAHCGHPVTDEAYRYCSECGEPLDGQGDEAGDERYGTEEDGEGDPNAGEYGDGDYSDQAWEAPPPSAMEQASVGLALVLAPVRDVAGQVGDAIESVLDDPRLRSHLPGESLTMLGLGLVVLALLLSLVPFVMGIGFVGSSLVLLAGVLVALNEWRGVTPPGTLPPALDNLPEETQHPGISQAFAALVCTQALLMMGFGLVSIVWLLAAIVLGFDQGRRFFASAEEEDQEAGGFRQGLDRWVVVGASLCTFALLLPWVRSNMPRAGLSGGEQPLATFTQLCLVVLAAFALRRRGLSALHPIVLVVMAVWLTLWFFLNMSAYTVGPWFFLLGLLMLDAVVVLHFLQMRGDRQPGADAATREPASDVDYQG